MKIIIPISVTASNLTATDVAITETEWVAGTYSTGTQRYVGEDLYEVVADPSTADEPTAGAQADPPSWLRIGKINRFKMFDGILGNATLQSGGTVDFTVVPGELITGVALFEVQANTVQVIVTDDISGEVYNRTMDLTSTVGVGTWYQYFYEPIERRTEVLFSDLPSFPNATVRVVVEKSTGDVQIGEVFMGRLRTLGVTLVNSDIGIEDFSRKERDTFGRFVIVERRFSKLATFDVFLLNNEVEATFRHLSARRALPTVYIGDPDREETLIAGFFRDFGILRSGPHTSEMTIEIEGLV